MSDTRPDAGGDRPRVVVTGMGAVCAAGLNVDEFTASLWAGRGGIGSVRTLDMSAYSTSLGGEVSAFNAENYFAHPKPKVVRRCVALALAAADEAVTRARLDLGAVNRDRVGIVLGTLLAGVRVGEVFHETWRRDGLRRAPGRLLRYQLPHTPADAVSARFGLKGPKSIVSTACASGGNAIGYGMDLIVNGKADVMLVGGVDPFSRFCFAGFNSLRALATGPCTPFSGGMGISIGEGAAILVLERLDAAAARGAPILAELLGYGLSADAYHPTAPEPSGSGMMRAITAALRAAGVAPEDISHINAHGTGTRENDETESRAIKSIFGPHAYKIPVCSTKSLTGHTMGAAGAIEAVASVVAITEQFVPPTINFDQPKSGCDLDYVANQSRPHPVEVVVSNSFGFGGTNAAVILSRYHRGRNGRGRGGPSRRVVVTGVGVASCVGVGVKAFWESVRAGQCGLKPVTTFDPSPYGCRIAGEIPTTEVLRHVNPAQLRHLDSLSRYAVACTRMAVKDSVLKISKDNAERLGVIFGTATGPIDTVEAFNRDIATGGPAQAKPFLFQNTVFNAAAGYVCQEFGIKGCTSTLVIGDASFGNAVAYGLDILRRGTMDGLVVVSADVFCEPLLAGFSKLKLLAADVCRPFDAARDGVTLSAAAAAVVLETLDHARSREARIYGEIRGYGMAADGGRCGAVSPGGMDWARAMTMALEDGNVRPEEIDYVAAAACGLPTVDLAETRAIKAALGARAYQVPVSAVRSMVGYAGSTGPALAFAAGLLATREQVIPPTANLVTQAGECDLDYVAREPLHKPVDAFLVNSFAWGGSYVSLACAKYGKAEDS